IAFCIFVFIKVVTSLQKKKEEKPAPEPTKEEVLLTEIRDALNKMADK
ncbi:MscL family protein, partial [Fusobacterium sp.]